MRLAFPAGDGDLFSLMVISFVLAKENAGADGLRNWDEGRGRRGRRERSSPRFRLFFTFGDHASYLGIGRFSVAAICFGAEGGRGGALRGQPLQDEGGADSAVIS